MVEISPCFVVKVPVGAGWVRVRLNFSVVRLSIGICNVKGRKASNIAPICAFIYRSHGLTLSLFLSDTTSRGQRI
ncbi:hypothetical protein [Ferrithrix thermotolerans]|uniref:hypothetical protein n=1 Tax=Ferrithrix thermotolerans TaxID=209649 RepID=UPI001160A401|nr:hypothetical protein [Ferrithrix thermotolerans]